MEKIRCVWASLDEALQHCKCKDFKPIKPKVRPVTKPRKPVKTGGNGK